jgi:hypothetical protein
VPRECCDLFAGKVPTCITYSGLSTSETESPSPHISCSSPSNQATSAGEHPFRQSEVTDILCISVLCNQIFLSIPYMLTNKKKLKQIFRLLHKSD